jgi:uncharacterized protein (DUF305 family)
MKKTTMALLLVAFLLSGAALGSQQQNPYGVGRGAETQRQSEGTQDEGRTLGVGAARMMPETPIRSEQDFIAEMISHHLEAVDASMLIFAMTGNWDLKRIARDIYVNQYRELEQLKLRYARAYQKVPAGSDYQPMMRDLDEISGRDREVRYAEDMLAHHQAAVAMARQALTLPALSEPMREFAREVVQQQGQEIGFIQAWLARYRR